MPLHGYTPLNEYFPGESTPPPAGNTYPPQFQPNPYPTTPPPDWYLSTRATPPSQEIRKSVSAYRIALYGKMIESCNYSGFEQMKSDVDKIMRECMVVECL